MAKKHVEPTIYIATRAFDWAVNRDGLRSVTRYEKGDEFVPDQDYEENVEETARIQRFAANDGIVFSRDELIDETTRDSPGGPIITNSRLLRPAGSVILPVRHRKDGVAESVPEGDEQLLTRSEVINELGENLGQLLIDNGFASMSSLAEADDEELLAIKGLGKSSLAKIREVA